MGLSYFLNPWQLFHAFTLALNTPMVDILNTLARLKIPKLFIELMGLIHRFIFVLLETVDTMFTAQKSRMGYASFSSGYCSLAALAATLLFVLTSGPAILHSS